MEWPHASIITWELHRQMSERTDQMHIPSYRVILPDDAAVPDTIALRKNLHIPSVNMPWVGCIQVIVQIDANRAVCSEVKYLPIIRERHVAL